jgi:hypothetical protein
LTSEQARRTEIQLHSTVLFPSSTQFLKRAFGVDFLDRREVDPVARELRLHELEEGLQITHQKSTGLEGTPETALLVF